MIFIHDTPTNRLLNMRLLSASPDVEDSAIGNPLTFQTDLAKPLRSLLVPFSPVQSGTGDPSPQNIRSILPWNGLNVFGGGKNLLNPAKYVFNTITSGGLTFEVQSDGSVKVTGTTESSDFGPTLSVRFKLHAGTYYGYRDDGNVYVAYRKSTSEEGGVTTGLVSPFTLDGSEWVYCNIYVRNPGTFDTILHPQIARENTQTAYEPYKPITETDISFPSPVYGGTLDVVSGVLTVEYGSVDLGTFDYIIEQTADEHQYFTVYYAIPNAKKVGNGVVSSYKCELYKTVKGSEIYTGASGNNAIAMVDSTPPGIRIRDDRFNTESEIKTALNGVMLYYELATPQEITLTSAQITALVGDNTIWSDADGSMTAVYLKKG